MYTTAGEHARISQTLKGKATVVGLTGDSLDYAQLLADLHRRGIRKLMVEGGSKTLASLVRAGLVDEFRLAVAPVYIAEPAGPALVAAMPWLPENTKLVLRSVEALGDTTVTWYVLAKAA